MIEYINRSLRKTKDMGKFGESFSDVRARDLDALEKK